MGRIAGRPVRRLLQWSRVVRCCWIAHIWDVETTALMDWKRMRGEKRNQETISFWLEQLVEWWFHFLKWGDWGSNKFGCEKKESWGLKIDTLSRWTTKMLSRQLNYESQVQGRSLGWRGTGGRHRCRKGISSHKAGWAHLVGEKREMTEPWGPPNFESLL